MSEVPAPLRIALVGVGNIGRKHLATIAAQSTATLVAIADPSDAAQPIADAHRVPRDRDVASLLARERPDAAIIATPNAQHAADALACIAAGVPVLVEKPLADTVEAGRRVAEASERAGVPVLVGHHRRHNRILARAHEVVRSGALGRLVAIEGSCLLRKPEDYFEPAWRRAPGAGPVLTNLVHDLDALRFLCGDIVAVQAFASSAIRGFGNEDSAAVALRFANGALGTLTASDTASGPWSWELTAGENPVYPNRPGSCYRLSGTDGALSIPDLTLWRYDGRPDWHVPMTAERLAVARCDPFDEQLRHFCAVVRRDEAPRVGARDALATLATIEALFASANSGRAVDVATGG